MFYTTNGMYINANVINNKSVPIEAPIIPDIIIVSNINKFIDNNSLQNVPSVYNTKTIEIDNIYNLTGPIYNEGIYKLNDLKIN
jgi:hypothetical protein